MKTAIVLKQHSRQSDTDLSKRVLSYEVISTHNTTLHAVGDRLNRKQVDELINVCGINVTVK